MSRAVHVPARSAVHRPHVRAALGAAAVAALSVASACLDDSSVAPDQGSVRLSISAQVAGGRTVAIEVSYRRSLSGGEGEELVRLPSEPERVTVQPGTVQVPVTVDVTQCLTDSRRVRSSGREESCPLVIVLRLLGDDDEELDSERIEPEPPAPGETVTLPTVTLRQPELVLSPAALTFEAVERGELPEAQHIAVSNGGGGSLGAITVTVGDGAGGWLEASLEQGGGSVSIRPTTTSLAPGVHTANVLVHSEGVPNSPQSAAISYEIAAIPRYELTVSGAGSGGGRIVSEPAGIECTIAAGVATGTCAASFDEGTLVFLDATPAEGSTLTAWSGACEGNGDCGVMMTGVREVTATFTLAPRVLAVLIAGSGSGRVVSSPAGIDCVFDDQESGGDCSAEFPHGTEVTLELTTGEGNVFGGWGGACTGTGACVVTMTEPRTVTALVHRLETLSIRRGSGSGRGVVRSSPEGIDCVVSPEGREGSCVATFAVGTQVTLQATPTAPSTFEGWEGVCDVSGPECAVTVDGPLEAGAIFGMPPSTLTVTLAGSGAGTVTSEPSGISCTLDDGQSSGVCAAQFPHGTLVTLTATAATGSDFSGWSGACAESGTCTVTLDESRAVTAELTLRRYAVIVHGFGNGSGRVVSTPAGIDCRVEQGVTSGACSTEVAHGTSMQLVPTADPFNEVGAWSSPCTGNGTCTLVIEGPVEVTAAFVRNSFAVTLRGAGGGAGTVTSSPEGMQCTSLGGVVTGQCSPFFLSGTEVALTATPQSGSQFAGWSGACTGTGPCVLLVDRAHEVTATFSPPLELSVTTAGGDGTGKVTSDPAGIECFVFPDVEQGTCRAGFERDTRVTLTAVAGDNSEFAGWSGACTGSGPCVVTMSEARSVAASFTLVRHQLTVTGSGPGSGSVTSSPDGIACTIESADPSGACASAFAHGTTVTLVAAPLANSVFAGWTGACSGTEPCRVTMTQAHAVGAMFALVPVRLDVQGIGAGAGTVTSDPVGIRCTISEGVETGECGASFPYGTRVQLIATPESGSRFDGWSGACTGAGECAVTLTAASTVTAAFGRATYTVSVQGAGNAYGDVKSDPPGITCTYTDGVVLGDCSEAFTAGSRVTLRAETDPESVAAFKGWSGACSGTGDCVLDVNQDLAVTATFAFEIPVNVIALGNGNGVVVSTPAGLQCEVQASLLTGTCSATFPLGTEVTVDAYPRFGSYGGIIGEQYITSLTFTLDEPAARDVPVEFLLLTYPLTVTGEGGGAGTVTSVPAGIACRHNMEAASDCAETYDHGTSVTLTATPESGNTFAGWGGACAAGTDPCTVSMTEARNVTARFEVTTRTLTVKGGGNGNGRISGGESDIDCTIYLGAATSGTCVAELPEGTVITLHADYYYYENEFLGWSGACTGTDQCTVTMTENKEVTATFDLNAPLSVEVLGDAMGEVTSDPGTIECTVAANEGGPGICENTFAGGTQVTLTAHTPTGARFVGWSGDCQGTEPTCTLTIDGGKDVIAEFESLTASVIVSMYGSGTGTVVSSPAGIDCTGSAATRSGSCIWGFPKNTEVSLTATPAEGSTFTDWVSGCSGTDPTCSLLLTADTYVIARFQPKQTLSLSTIGNGAGSVTSSPAGVACSYDNGTRNGTCTTSFDYGSPVTLTASPATGSTHHWEGACLAAGTAAQCTVTMTQAQNATIVFEKLTMSLTVSIEGGGSGRVSTQTGLTPAIDCVSTEGVLSGSCVATYPYGTLVQLTATTTPGSGYRVGGWSGACSGTTQPCTLPTNLSGPVGVTASIFFDECELAVPHTLFSTSEGQLARGDCQIDQGIYRDRYSISTASQQLYYVQSSTTMPSELRVSLGSGGYYYSRSSVGGAHLVLSPSGTTSAEVVNTTADRLGTYTLSTQSRAYDGCTARAAPYNVPLRTTFGVSASFTLAAGDCLYVASIRPGTTSPSDLLTIYVPSGRRLRVRVQSSQFDPVIEVRSQVGFTDADWTGTVLGTSAPAVSGSASLDLPFTGGGYLHIWVTSRTAGGTGSYSIQILQ